MQDHAPRVADGVTAGRLLRRAREASGMHIAALAVSLKVPVRKLEALEEDRHEQLPDIVFTRSLASSVCRALKVDPQPILDRLPQNATPRLVRDVNGLNAPFRVPGDTPASGWRQQLTRPASLAVIVLMVAAAVIVVLPISRGDDKVASSTTARPSTPAVPAQKVENVQTVALTLAVPPQDAASAPAAAAGVAPVAPAADASPASGIVAAATPASAVVADPQAAAAAGIVVIRAKGESWVEITDAKGVVAVRKLLATGESAGASGALPLQVTIGRADLTDVQVRGQPYDLRGVSRDNVARFEVK